MDQFISFGKHKGERWTRIPIGYLKWLLNELDPEDDRAKKAMEEIARRGTNQDINVELSGHAIDRASLRLRKIWHETRNDDEGIYSWLLKITNEALEANRNKEERFIHKGVKFIFSFGNYYPTLKSIMPGDNKRKNLSNGTEIKTEKGELK